MSETSKLTRDVMANENLEEVQATLMSDITLYTEEIGALKTLEDLKAAEAELMKEFDENDEFLKNRTYTLPDQVEYDGQTFKRGDIVNAIIGFMNGMEVPFQATLGIYQGIRYWKTRGSEPVSYAVFDNTIRLLGTLKFKGERDCLNILVINNWFAGAHNSYRSDTVWTNYLAAKHDVIIKAMDALKEPEEGEGNPDAQV